MNLNNFISYTYTYAIRQPKDAKKKGFLASPRSYTPPLNTLPSNHQTHRMPAPRIHRRLRRATWHRTRRKRRTAPRRQIPVHSREDGRSADAGPARQRAR